MELSLSELQLFCLHPFLCCSFTLLCNVKHMITSVFHNHVRRHIYFVWIYSISSMCTAPTKHIAASRVCIMHYYFP